MGFLFFLIHSSLVLPYRLYAQKKKQRVSLFSFLRESIILYSLFFSQIFSRRNVPLTGLKKTAALTLTHHNLCSDNCMFILFILVYIFCIFLYPSFFKFRKIDWLLKNLIHTPLELPPSFLIHHNFLMW